MKKFTVYSSSGDKVSEIQLSDRVFAVPAKVSVIHQLVVAEDANARSAISHTKTRGEVRGGGKKPWKQKGTGYARAGSIRSPLWRKGGTTFGPRSNRNYSQKVSRTLFRTGLRMVLSDLAASGKLVIIDNFEIPSGKAKDFAKAARELFAKADLQVTSAAFVTAKADAALRRAVRNVPQFSLITVDQVTPRTLLKAKTAVITTEALAALEKRLA